MQIVNRKSKIDSIKDHKGMRPQDVVVLLAIVALRRDGWESKNTFRVIHRKSYPENKYLAELLNISSAEVSASLYRSSYGGLISDITNSKEVLLQSLLEFLKYGLKYVFPTQPGAKVRGAPTAHSAQPLKDKLSFEEEIVWEHPDGSVRGHSIAPLYSCTLC